MRQLSQSQFFSFLTYASLAVSDTTTSLQLTATVLSIYTEQANNVEGIFN